jgi:hypothetical protein
VILGVECYAGARGDETPRRLRLGGHTLEVVDVLERWLEPAHRCFKVRCVTGATFTIRQDRETREWELAGFEGAGA